MVDRGEQLGQGGRVSGIAGHGRLQVGANSVAPLKHAGHPIFFQFVSNPGQGRRQPPGVAEAFLADEERIGLGDRSSLVIPLVAGIAIHRHESEIDGFLRRGFGRFFHEVSDERSTLILGQLVGWNSGMTPRIEAIG